MNQLIRAVVPLAVIWGAASARADDFHDSPALVAFQLSTGHVFGASGTTVIEWDPQTGQAVRTIQWPGRTIQLLTTTQDGKLVLGVDDKGKVTVWDLGQSKVARTIEAAVDGGDVKSFDVSPDGRVLAITDPLNVKLFDLTSGRSIKTIKLEAGAPTDVRFSPGGKTLAISSGGMLFFDAAGQPAREFSSETRESGGRRAFDALAWTPDGRIVGAAGHLVLADAKTPHVLGDIDHGLGSNGHHLVITADGKWAGMSLDHGPGGDGGIAWFTLPSLALKATWKLDRVVAMAISRDGKLVAVAAPDATVKILDAGANKLTVLRTMKISATSAPVADAPPPAGKPAAPPKGSEKLLKDVAYAAMSIQLENDQTEARVVESSAKDCETAVAAALAANVPETVEVTVEAKFTLPGSRPAPDGFSTIMSLAGIRDHACSAGRIRFTLMTVSVTASDAVVWIGKIQHPDKDNPVSDSSLEYATTTGQKCRAAVGVAKKANIPRTTMVTFFTYTSDLKSPLSLQDVDDKICGAAIAMSKKALAESSAAEKATYAPYLAVLSGDKAKMFWEKRMLGGENWYGHGGKRLTKPADFASSDVWYYYVVDRNGVVPRWEVEGWTFAGVKNTGVYDRSGSGDTPPSSAYK